MYFPRPRFCEAFDSIQTAFDNGVVCAVAREQPRAKRLSDSRRSTALLSKTPGLKHIDLLASK